VQAVSRLAEDGDFYAEIEEAAVSFPRVVTRLLYEARRQSA
jgi:hypothetical protein